MKSPKKTPFFGIKKKTNSNFVVKLAEMSNRSFSLSIWWITFFKHLYSMIWENDCIELNWLCKHMEKVRISQASISINSCTELSKTQFFPEGIFKSRYWNIYNRKLTCTDFFGAGLGFYYCQGSIYYSLIYIH